MPIREVRVGDAIQLWCVVIPQQLHAFMIVAAHVPATTLSIVKFSYHNVSVSRYSCEGLPYGYYSDPENSCQVFHICNPINGGTQQGGKTLQYRSGRSAVPPSPLYSV